MAQHNGRAQCEMKCLHTHTLATLSLDRVAAGILNRAGRKQITTNTNQHTHKKPAHAKKLGGAQRRHSRTVNQNIINRIRIFAHAIYIRLKYLAQRSPLRDCLAYTRWSTFSRNDVWRTHARTHAYVPIACTRHSSSRRHHRKIIMNTCDDLRSRAAHADARHASCVSPPVVAP